MVVSRRKFLDLAAATAAASGAMGWASIAEAASPAIKAIAFDAFPIFDPRSLSALARQILGDRGDAFYAQWSTKLFEYTWLETAAGRYESFPTIADHALSATAEAMRIELSASQRAALVSHYNELGVWPDVKPALERLRAKGIRLVFLSNLSLATLRVNIERNGLQDYFEPPLSTDAVRQFKPSPKAYAMALEAFGLPKEQIGFVAFGGWDAIGATWFGYRTVWVNRLNNIMDRFDTHPEIVSQDISGVLTLAGIA